MPTVHREEGFRFFFYSNEGNPREPPHVHVERGEGDAKVWLDDPPRLDPDSHGFSDRERSVILRIVGARRAEMEASWHEHFGAIRPLR